MNVLILEDDFSIVAMIIAAAKPHGIDFEHARSITEAMNHLEQFKPDLVWTDVGLSAEESGIEILKHVKNTVPAVICTGYERSALGFARYWKYVQKGPMAGYGYISVMLRAYFAAAFLQAIIAGKSCPEMGKFAADELNKNIDVLQKGIITRLFSRETECLDLWLGGKKEEAAIIARGLLDGSLC